jgi:hypothetical protein
MSNSLDNIEKYVKEAIAQAVPEMQESLQNKAKDFGWDKQLASRLGITSSDNGLALDYPDNDRSAVEDSEYGFIGKPPKAAIRNFAAPDGELSKKVEKAMYTALNRVLAAAGIL